jgi:two-component system response regulator FixJ
MEGGGARRVYVIDDDPKVLASTAFLLSTLGYECMTFSSADDFLARAGDLLAGCVLTDLRMPVTDGLELTAKFKKLGFDWPVVMMTSDHGSDLAVRAATRGILTVLTKPVGADILVDTLTAAFDKLDA